MDIPTWLEHKPVIAVDYQKFRKYNTDAKYLSLGRATWDENDFSAKIWRWVEDREKKKGRWSRQSEELPFDRLLDLTRLFLSAIFDKESGLCEEVLNENGAKSLASYLDENMELYLPRIEAIKNLLQKEAPSENSNQHTPAPNIFSFATSELSQDAILAYMLQWADSQYEMVNPQMHALGVSLFHCLTGDDSVVVNTIEVGRQLNDIDVYAKVNGNLFLIIEDKTKTTIHGRQLEKYRTFAEETFGNSWQIKLAYVKTGNEPIQILNQVKNAGYRVVLRIDLLNVLNQYQGTNPMIKDFRTHLQTIETETQSYQIIPVDSWEVYSKCWQGLYMALEQKIPDFGWKYVPNKAGGFWGAFWHFLDIQDGQIYLQIESGKFCFKLSYWGEKSRSHVRNYCFHMLQNIANSQYPELHKPNRFGSGEYMTFMVVEKDDLFGKGLVDIESLLLKLRGYGELLDALQQKIKNEPF